MNRGVSAGGSLIFLCLVGCLVFYGCAGIGGTPAGPGGSGREAEHPSDEVRTILYLDGRELITTGISSLTSVPSEVLSGEYSLMGSYSGTGSYTPYLYTDCRFLPLKPLTTCQVSFDYRILEAPDRGFETILFSPAAGEQNLWLPGSLVTGEPGDSGTASFTNTLGDFSDYQVRWNIVGTGAVTIDNIRILDVESGEVLLDLDLEAARGVIEVSRRSLRTKVENRPTIPVFYAWCDSPRDSGFDTEEHPYSLVWTTRGLPWNQESTAADLSPRDSLFMQNDRDTLYIISEQWHYWFPAARTLSPSSLFYLDEPFEPHLGTEYPDTLMLNFEDPGWPEVMAEKALSFKRAGFDGMILDWWNDGAGNGRPLSDVRKARLAILKAVREKVGDAFILMGNVNFHTDDPTSRYLSGVFMELWKPEPGKEYALTYDQENGAVWTPSIQRFEDALKYWDSALQWPRIIAFEPWKITREDYIADRTSPENLRYARLFAAMACVIPENGYILYADNNDDWVGGDHQHAYYEFYRTDLGKPVSGMIRIAEGAAWKQYERGIIAYNRTAGEIDVRLPSGRRLRLGPLEGVFLEDLQAEP